MRAFGWWLLVVSSSALAVSPESSLLSKEGALGGAVLAADDEGGGGWYNPASLGGVTRNSLQLGISAYSVAWVDTSRSLVTTTPWDTQEQGAHTFRYSSLPSVLGLTWRLKPGLGVSVGLWTPYHDSFATSLDTAGAGPLPQDPSLTARLTQRYDWTQSADDTWAAAAAGWQVHPRLRLGASLQGVYSSADRSIEVNTLLETDSMQATERGAHLHVRVREKSDTIALRGVLGAQWMPTSALRLALAVRTPRVQVFKHRDRVQVILVSALLPGFGVQEGGFVAVEPKADQLAVIDPTRVLAGGQLELGHLSLRLDGEWSPGFAIAGGDLKTSVRVRAGALYQWNENLTVGLGGSFDSARTSAAQGTLALDTIGLSGGVTRRSADVIRALGGGAEWDLLNTIAVAGVMGFGKAPGMVIYPLSLDQSVLPVLPGKVDQPFVEVPARTFDVSVHFMTTLEF